MLKNIIKNTDNLQKKMLDTIVKTPLEYNKRLSDKYQANIYLKREDLQITRLLKLEELIIRLIKLI